MDRSRVVRVLGLFSGIGGLERGVTAGLGDVGLDAQCVGMVEGEAFGAGCLEAAMRRGDLAPAPVWLGDIREFPAADFAGAVDLVVAGFPCQPASAAGKRKGTGDERWLWPEVVRVVRESRAPLVFLENVRGLLNVNRGGAFAEVLQGLADLGFDAEWTLLPAAAVGAPHRRERVFVLGWRRVADSGSAGGRGGSEAESRGDREDDGVLGPDGRDVADSDGHGLATDEHPYRRQPISGERIEALADAGRRRDERRHNAGGVGAVQAGVEADARERERARDDAWDGEQTLDNTASARRDRERGWTGADGGGGERLPCPGRPTLADDDGGSDAPGNVAHGCGTGHGRGFPLPWPPGPGERALWRWIIAADPGLAPAVAAETQSGVRRVDDGLPAGLDRPEDVGPDRATARAAFVELAIEFGECVGPRIYPCDEHPGRWDIADIGMCVGFHGLRQWVRGVMWDDDEVPDGLRTRIALADDLCRRLGERADEAQRERPEGRRGLEAPSGGGAVPGDEAGAAVKDCRIDRLRALGNAVVAPQAAAAFAGLWRRAFGGDA